MTSRFAWSSVSVVAAITIAACTSDRMLGPRFANGTGRVFPVRVVAGNYDRLQFPRGRSEYQCTITSQHSDGKYYHTVAWLRIPAEYKDPGGALEVYRLEWQPSAGSPVAGANCKVPRTPAAEKFLHEKVFYIDPKTLRSNGPTSPASAQGAGGPFGGSIAYATTLQTVIIIGHTPMWMSGSNSRSNPGTGVSVPSWTGPDYSYVAPGQPCYDDNWQLTGIGVETSLSFESLPPEVMCPITPYPSLCLDQYIASCTVAGLGSGDCRTADPYAPQSKSRAQIQIPLSQEYASLARTYLSPTCWRGRVFCNAPLGTDQNQVSISYVGDTIAVTFRLANAITNFIPTIDGAFRFIPQGDGTFYVEGRRDPYPSLSVVLSRNGVNTIMLQRDETKTRELSDWFGLRDMFALCIPPQ